MLCIFYMEFFLSFIYSFILFYFFRASLFILIGFFIFTSVFELIGSGSSAALLIAFLSLASLLLTLK